MTKPIPKFSKTQVNKAGALLASPDALLCPPLEFLEAVEILSNWRACHGYPINTFQSTLRDKLRKIDADALVAQRLKRMPSIIKKLQRSPYMNLARMQDIGGLRAVVTTVNQLKKLHENYKNSKFTHSLISERNYIDFPKTSGYRSIHLVYRYKHKNSSLYDGLQLELQLRTKLQHVWATTVETVGTFINHSLKSSEGPDEWLKFFSLVGSAFSHLEDSPQVPNYETLSKKETFLATTEEVNRLGIRHKLRSYSSAVKAITPATSRSAAYYLIQLNLQTAEKSVFITPFRRDQLEEANIAYSKAEQKAVEKQEIQVVLVSAGSVESLQRAYPNYFLDTNDFLEQLGRIQKGSR